MHVFSPNSWNMSPLARPLTMPNFVMLKKCARYPLSKIWALGKVDQNSPKSLKTCYAIMPVIVQNFISLGQRCMRKALEIFFHLSLFLRSRTTWVKVHQSGWWCTATSLYQAAKFCPVPKTPLWDICCQSSSISLMVWPHTHTNTKRYVSAYHAATLSFNWEICMHLCRVRWHAYICVVWPQRFTKTTTIVVG